MTVSRFNVRAAVQQGFSDLNIASSRRHVKGRTMLDAITGVYVRAGSNQRLHHSCAGRRLTLVSNRIQGSVAAVIHDVGFGAKL